MRSEGYSSWICLSVCLSGKPHLTSEVSVCPEIDVMYSTGNEGKNICGIFSETASLQRSSIPSVVRPYVYDRWPYFTHVRYTCEYVHTSSYEPRVCTLVLFHYTQYWHDFNVILSTMVVVLPVCDMYMYICMCTCRCKCGKGDFTYIMSL